MFGQKNVEEQRFLAFRLGGYDSSVSIQIIKFYILSIRIVDRVGSKSSASGILRIK